MDNTNNTDNATSDAGTPTTLLEHLRQYPGETSHPSSWSTEICTKVMRQIVEHVSEFPSNVRFDIEIVIARELSDAKEFCLEVYDALESFLTPPEPILLDSEELDELFHAFFHAGSFIIKPDPLLHCDLHTKEELEVAIRVFPNVLKDNNRDPDFNCSPIAWATCSLKTLPFVPLLVELECELEVFEENENFGLFSQKEPCPIRELFSHRYLVSHSILRGVDIDEEFDRRIDEIAFSILKIQMNYLGSDDFFAWAFEQMVCFYDDLRFPRIEKRLGLVIDNYEDILEGYDKTRIDETVVPLLPYFLLHGSISERFSLIRLNGIKNELSTVSALKKAIKFHFPNGAESEMFSYIIRNYEQDAEYYKDTNWRQDYSNMFKFILERGIWLFPEKAGFLFRNSSLDENKEDRDFYNSLLSDMTDWQKEAVTRGVEEVLSRLSYTKPKCIGCDRSYTRPKYIVCDRHADPFIIPMMTAAVATMNRGPWTEHSDYQGRELQTSILYHFLRQDPIKAFFHLANAKDRIEST